MKKYTIVLFLILLNTRLLLVMGNDPSADEYRSERLIGFLEKVSLPDEKSQAFSEHLHSINAQFNEFLVVKDNFSDQVRNGENIWLGLNEEYQATISETWRAYSENMKSFTLNLEEILSPPQINLFYDFLFDELWYEGIITNENTKVTESLLESNESKRNADTTEFIREYGRDTFEKMLREYDEEPDFPSKKDLVLAEPYKADNIREIEPIFAEDVDEQFSQAPPWKEMDRPPATIVSVQYFFEEQNLSALKYYHLTLFPQMLDLLRNN